MQLKANLYYYDKDINGISKTSKQNPQLILKG